MPANKMDQWVKVLATTPANLSLSPRINIVEREKQLSECMHP